LITAAAIVGSALVWIPIACGDLLYSGWHPLSITAWLGLGWLAIMSTVVAYLAWFKGLEKIEGSAAASTLFVQPLLGTILAIVLLNDQILPTTILGGLLIIVSVYLISRY
jgi:drug/metabolite transporter (DMT)-like permease